MDVNRKGPAVNGNEILIIIGTMDENINYKQRKLVVRTAVTHLLKHKLTS